MRACRWWSTSRLPPPRPRPGPLVEQAEEKGILITAYMNRRWDSDQLTLRRLLDEKLGEVLRYESRLERWQPVLTGRKPWTEVSPPEAGGGVLLDLGSHLVDQAIALFGAVVQSMRARKSPRRRRRRRCLPGTGAPLRRTESPLGVAARRDARATPARARRPRGLPRHRGRRAGRCTALGRQPER